MKSFLDLDIGDSVADMHGKNFRCAINWWIKEPIEIVSHVDWETNAFGEFLDVVIGRDKLRMNKYLYVIGHSMDQIVVGYSYDARRAGIAKIQLAPISGESK